LLGTVWHTPACPRGKTTTTQTRATYGGLCGMPACGQAVGCGVCDTPELWRGAAGLCARVRACAGAGESLHTYIHTSLGTYGLNPVRIVSSIG